MQLMWMSGPVGQVRTLSISRPRLIAAVAVAAVALLVLGNLLHFVGLRLAVEYRPDLLRMIGGVMTVSDLDGLEAGYRQRLDKLREETAANARQVAELRALKDSFMQLAMPRHSARQPVRAAESDRGYPDAIERRRQRQGGIGGPPSDQQPLPSGAALPRPGASLFEEIGAARREARAQATWIRQARADWAMQLAWVDAQPTGPPIANASVSSRFGARVDPFTSRFARHEGLDLVAPPGTPILAAAPGVVMRAAGDPQYGLMVEIDHGNGYTTRYAHAQSLLVRRGDRVGRGAPIATVGSTGRSTAPHLHFEVRHRGAARDPQQYLLGM